MVMVLLPDPINNENDIDNESSNEDELPYNDENKDLDDE